MSGRYQEGYVQGCRKGREDAEPEIERLRAENAQLRADHIAAHRVNVATITWLEGWVLGMIVLIPLLVAVFLLTH
jgi:hypothetical protein